MFQWAVVENTHHDLIGVHGMRMDVLLYLFQAYRLYLTAEQGPSIVNGDFMLRESSIHALLSSWAQYYVRCCKDCCLQALSWLRVVVVIIITRTRRNLNFSTRIIKELQQQFWDAAFRDDLLEFMYADRNKTTCSTTKSCLK